jgi:hypothetical protein
MRSPPDTGLGKTSADGAPRTLPRGALVESPGENATGLQNESATKGADMPYTPDNNQGAAKSTATTKKDIRPTHDELYLASRLSPDDAPTARLSPAAIQRLNSRYGVQTVLDAMRLMRGFPPEIAVRSPYAYLETLCKGAK